MIKNIKTLSKIVKALAHTDECGVRGCEGTSNVELVELKPFDPIDHSSTYVALCASHQEWADERNTFAKAVASELRSKRKEIGQNNIGRIQELALPQTGDMREDILMGEVTGQIPLEEAFEETHQTGRDLLEGDS